jgi:nucleoside-diphosphate-sugar epimerase
MKILITGVHGFVGSNLVNNLAGHHDIYGLDILSRRETGLQFTLNWSEMDKFPQLDTIIHLAGKAHDIRNSSSEEEYFKINVGLTQKIFQFFLTSSATKFLFFSSVKAVSDSPGTDIVSEKNIPTPLTAYGKSKLKAEEYILSEWQKWSSNSFNEKRIYILRPCMIHGPGNKGNLNLLYKFSQKRIPWPLGSFENKRSFSSVDNVSYVIKKLIENIVESGIYNIADDDPVSTNEIIQLMAECFNKRTQIWKISPGLIRSIAKTGDVLNLPLNSERLNKLTESYMVSNEKLKQALGIEKMPVPAIDGLRKTLNSFKL